MTDARFNFKHYVFILLVTTISINGFGQGVKYGDAIHIKNKWGNDYLDSCGNTDCSPTTRNQVSTNKFRDRDDAGTGIWFIESVTGKTGTIRFGDAVHIKNKWGNNYLDSCNSADCSPTTRNQVSTNTLPDRDGAGTGTWFIESVTGKTGIVEIGDEVYIRNKWGNYYLDSCNSADCSESSQNNVSTNTLPDRTGNGTGRWTFESVTGKTGIVKIGHEVYIRNKWGNDYLDSCNSADCSESSGYKVSTNTLPDRTGNGTGRWAFKSIDKEYPYYHEGVISGNRVAFKCKKSVLEQVDGCSIPEMVKIVNVPEFEPACNQHDINYKTPWSLAGVQNGKMKSDLQFESYMQEISGSNLVYKAAARTYFSTVALGADDAYRKGQEWSKKNCVLFIEK